MIENRRYTPEEFKQLMKELTKNSRKDFQPRYGTNVTSDDIKNNKQAVEDIMNNVQTIYKGLSSDNSNNRTTPTNMRDLNKSTLDYNFNNEVSDTYKTRVKAQVHGYSSADNEKSVEERNADFEGNTKYYAGAMEKSEGWNEKEKRLKVSGLASRTLPEKSFDSKTLYTNEQKVMKRLRFKKSVFLNEEQVRDMVPEEYKVDGNRFIMTDANGKDWLVECAVDKDFNHAEVKVLGKFSKEGIDEQVARMRSLYSYDTINTAGKLSSRERKEEIENVGKLIEGVRRLNSMR